MLDTLKEELTKKPEQLNEKQLGQATALANILTGMRRVSFMIFYLLASMSVIYIIKQTNVVSPVPEIVSIILIIFIIFKIRDLIRGTI